MNSIFLVVTLLLVHCARAYDPAPRWGQAQMLMGDSLFVYGGKTDQFNSYSYTGAPSTNDLLLLPLSSPFNASSPPWNLLASSSNGSTVQGPTLAWASLSAVKTSLCLLFGGIADPNSDISVQTRADSTVLMDALNPLELQLTLHPSSSYTNEPVRRMQQATCSTPDGRVFIIGGVKPDGSGSAFSQHYIFYDTSGPTYVPLESESSAGPPDIYGHACIMLPSGYLLVLGGMSPSSGGLVPFDTIWALDTSPTHQKAVWSMLAVDTNNLPSPRRGFIAVLLSDGRILIHGGQDAQGQTVFSDGWILDLNGQDSRAVWSLVGGLSDLGPRRDHFAVVSGDEVIFGFGYTLSSPAPAALWIYNVPSNTFVASHTPPTIIPSPTIPGVSQTPIPTSPPWTRPGSGGHHGSSGLPISGTATAIHPTSTVDGGHGSGNGTVGHDKGTDNSSPGIAIGAALGAVTLLLVVACAVWYHRRRSRLGRERAQFHLLGGSDDHEASPGSGGDIGNALGVALVGAAAVGTAAALPNEKSDVDRMQGSAPHEPHSRLADVDIGDLRATIYNNISNASFATPLVPSPATSQFGHDHQESNNGVAGVLGRGVDAVTGVVSAGVTSLAAVLGVSLASSHRRGDDRALPRRVRTPPERRDMLADEDTREFAYSGLLGHSKWRSNGGSSHRKIAWSNYERRRADGSADSNWSLRSLFGAGGGGVRGLWTREPSGASRGSSRSRTSTPWGTSWNEKGDSSGTDEEGYVAVMRNGSGKSNVNRQHSNVSTRSSVRYVDPFADPVQEDGRGDLSALSGLAAGAHQSSRNSQDERSDGAHSDYTDMIDRHLSQPPPIRTVLPVSQLHPQTLSPLSEVPSQPSLVSPSQDLTQSQTLSQSSHGTQSHQSNITARSRGDSMGSSYDHSPVLSPFERPSSSHTSFGIHAQSLQKLHSPPFDTPNSPSTSSVSARPSSILDPPSASQASVSSNAAAPSTLLSTTPSQPMRRSDTWWARFARTRFLDRSSSDASRRNGGMIDIRDPNPPPRLNPIEESQHSGSGGTNESVGSLAQSETDVATLDVSRVLAIGKSTTSLQTTHTVDSEALERLGVTMNVVQRIRYGNGSADSGGPGHRLSRADTISTDESAYDVDVAVLSGMFRTRSPVDMSDDEVLPLTSSPKTPNSPTTKPLRSPSYRNSSPITPQSGASSPLPLASRPPSSGHVAARVAAYERRMSQDLENPQPTQPKAAVSKEERGHRKRVDYGLVPRPSLYVANPDARRGSSNDS